MPTELPTNPDLSDAPASSACRQPDESKGDLKNGPGSARRAVFRPENEPRQMTGKMTHRVSNAPRSPSSDANGIGVKAATSGTGARAPPPAVRRHVRARSHRDNEIKFFTIADVAERLHVATRTVRRWIDADDLVAHRFGGVIRIAEGDLRAFLALHREG